MSRTKNKSRRGRRTEAELATKTPTEPRQPTAGRALSATTISRTDFYSGPLPHPDILAGYEQLLPGTANQIIDQWVKQGEHRRGLEQYILTRDARRADWGLVSGTLVTLAVIALGAYLGNVGQPVVGAVLVGVDVVGLAGVFIYGTASKRREREASAAQVPSKK